MGEAWHNNHHAFPSSARLGLRDGEVDPGWWVLRMLQSVGLVCNVKTPETLPYRANLIPLGCQSIFRKKPAPDLIRGGHWLSAENTTK
jgi:stearoyl-CoA desaturase (delta-9 desaturase)